MKQTSPPFDLLFFIEPPHDCNYFSDRRASTLFVDPRYPKDRRLQTLLLENGFRRSGEHLYRPYCRGCRACVSVRLPVADFRPRRSQRRAWRKNEDLTVLIRPPTLSEEHFGLYARYIDTRHPEGGMANPTQAQYLDFLTAPWAETLFIEFRLEKRLLGVCVVDRLDNGLSAVYTFFEPGCPERGLGVYAILRAIHEARRADLDWLYLGYWIETSPKMCYKSEYRPQERLSGGQWKKRHRRTHRCRCQAHPGFPGFRRHKIRELSVH
uniref:Aspartate/glutamate leucyltransferase n=1 Tax=Candidatus Kentrum eta TaxID=2126337 RepID=A0A450VFN6_9GAMM|nr:MAG: arginine-tRNA-protein transferase [Candidatus Kentron sp. H]VFJ98631.1 MAG: arginine-tRNA-protein transferase [Candidatus Kentron sp. H]VFK03633.1 MAG: arginine-tRNA-protein transferase [Candidatus Kentron sp. H]